MHPGSCILELAGGLRRGEIGFGRFLRNPAVTVQALSEAAGDRTRERVQGRDILAIQDTSEIVLGGPKMRQAGFGPVGRGGFLGGVLVHPVLAVDAGQAGSLLALLILPCGTVTSQSRCIIQSGLWHKRNRRNG